MTAAALAEMERVLDSSTEPAIDARWTDMVTRRWRHGPLHECVGPMHEDVAMAYCGTPRRIERIGDGMRVRSITADTSETFIPAGSAAHWDIAGDLDVVHIYIAPERLRRVADDAEVGADWAPHGAVAEEDARLSDLIRLLGANLTPATKLDRLYADTLSELVCLHLVRGPAAFRAPPLRLGLAPWQVGRVCDYLIDNIDRQVGLQELSMLLDLSAKHLCTAFRQATGDPPHRWMRARRVDEGKRRLRDTQDTILCIALDLGYASETAFSAMFRDATGTTPSNYRRLRPIDRHQA